MIDVKLLHKMISASDISRLLEVPGLDNLITGTIRDGTKDPSHFRASYYTATLIGIAIARTGEFNA